MGSHPVPLYISRGVFYFLLGDGSRLPWLVTRALWISWPQQPPPKSSPTPSQPNTLASLSQGWVSPVSSLLDALTRLHLSPETVPEPGSKPAFLHAQEDARWLHHQDEGEEVGRTHGSCAKQGLLRRVLPEWAPLRGEARTRCPDPAGSPSPPSSPSQPPGPPALPRTPAL